MSLAEHSKRDVFQTIQENQGRISLEDLARLSGYSPRTVFRRVKEYEAAHKIRVVHCGSAKNRYKVLQAAC